MSVHTTHYGIVKRRYKSKSAKSSVFDGGLTIYIYGNIKTNYFLPLLTILSPTTYISVFAIFLSFLHRALEILQMISHTFHSSLLEFGCLYWWTYTPVSYIGWLWGINIRKDLIASLLRNRGPTLPRGIGHCNIYPFVVSALLVFLFHSHIHFLTAYVF